MNDVFLSWSGSRSKYISERFGDFLPNVLQPVNTWSSGQIPKGSMWVSEISAKLKDSIAGLIFVTPENQLEQWLNFEAGALAIGEAFGSRRVCPVLYGLQPADLIQPLSLFQAIDISNKKEVLELVFSINKSLGDRMVDEDKIKSSFSNHWRKLANGLKKTPALEDFGCLLTIYNENGELSTVNFSNADERTTMHEALHLAATPLASRMAGGEQNFKVLQKGEEYKVLNIKKKSWMQYSPKESMVNFLIRNKLSEICFVHNEFVYKQLRHGVPRSEEEAATVISMMLDVTRKMQ